MRRRNKCQSRMENMDMRTVNICLRFRNHLCLDGPKHRRLCEIDEFLEFKILDFDMNISHRQQRKFHSISRNYGVVSTVSTLSNRQENFHVDSLSVQ